MYRDETLLSRLVLGFWFVGLFGLGLCGFLGGVLVLVFLLVFVGVKFAKFQPLAKMTCAHRTHGVSIRAKKTSWNLQTHSHRPDKQLPDTNHVSL